MSGVLGGASSDAVASSPLPGDTGPKRIRIGGVVEATKLVSQTRPEYPPLARTARIQGVVRMDAIIATDGTIEELKVISGHPLLARAALDAVKQWRYQPTLLNGLPMEVATEIDVNFSLAGVGANTGGAGGTVDPDSGTASSPGGAASVSTTDHRSVTPPVPIYKPDPQYSEEARQAKIEGSVTLIITIDTHGDVTDCRVTKGLGKGLDEEAVKTVLTWKFKPALRNDVPVPVRVTVVVSFRLFR